MYYFRSEDLGLIKVVSLITVPKLGTNILKSSDARGILNKKKTFTHERYAANFSIKSATSVLISFIPDSSSLVRCGIKDTEAT